MKGGILDFKKESRELAQLLGSEHAALGELIEVLENPDRAPQIQDMTLRAKEAHEAVSFQKKRTDAARGEAVKATA